MCLYPSDNYEQTEEPATGEGGLAVILGPLCSFSCQEQVVQEWSKREETEMQGLVRLQVPAGFKQCYAELNYQVMKQSTKTRCDDSPGCRGNWRRRPCAELEKKDA